MKPGVLIRYLLLAVALCLGTLRAGSAGVKVIANPSVKTSVVLIEDLRCVFLSTKTSLPDGSRVAPVLLKSGAAHEAFVVRYIGKTAAGLETYYRSLVFAGRALMPPAFASEGEVIRYVARTRGAIGYVSSEASLSGVKTLEIQ